MQIIGIAVAAFAATNVDDMLLLGALFATHGGPRAHRRIVAGQFGGFGVIILASAAVAWLLTPVRGPALGLLGLIPVALGVRALATSVNGGIATPAEQVNLTTARAVLVTISTGGDNISAYGLLFRHLGLGFAVAASAIFAVFLAVMCVIGVTLIRRPREPSPAAGVLSVIGPAVMVVIGVLICIRAGTTDWVLHSLS